MATAANVMWASTPGLEPAHHCGRRQGLRLQLPHCRARTPLHYRPLRRRSVSAEAGAEAGGRAAPHGRARRRPAGQREDARNAATVADRAQRFAEQHRTLVVCGSRKIDDGLRLPWRSKDGGRERSAAKNRRARTTRCDPSGPSKVIGGRGAGQRGARRWPAKAGDGTSV